jgi:hypothetical protein
MTLARAVIEAVVCASVFAVLFLQGTGTAPNNNNNNNNKKKRTMDLQPEDYLREAKRQRTNIAPVAPVIEEPALCPDATIPKFSRSDVDVIRPEHSLMDHMTLFVESADNGPIYILPRNGSTQVYIAKHLACKHTVRELQYALDYLPRLSPPREVR